MNQKQIKNFQHVKSSPSGNRTQVTRVTGGYTHHYTNEEISNFIFKQVRFSTHILAQKGESLH